MFVPEISQSSAESDKEENSLNRKMDYVFQKLFFFPAFFYTYLLNVLILIAFVVPCQSCFFRGTQTLPHPGLFSLP